MPEPTIQPGDVLRLTLDNVSQHCLDFVIQHGNLVIVTEVFPERSTTLCGKHLNVLSLEGLDGVPMLWNGDSDPIIPLYDSEFSVEPLLTAVRRRKHGGNAAIPQG